MFKDWIRKYVGSTRLFFSLLSFGACLTIVLISFFWQLKLDNNQLKLLLGVLGSSMTFIAAETYKKS